MLKNGEFSFQSLADSIRGKFIDMALDDIFTNMFKNIGGGGISGFIGGLFASANGNAFNNGKVMAFANGGVVNSPTLFPMANGTGLMGESGPEAVMPLKRGSNGKLGVEASGGSTPTIVQNINISAGNGDTQLAELVKTAAAQGYQRVLSDFQRNGPGRRSLGV